MKVDFNLSGPPVGSDRLELRATNGAELAPGLVGWSPDFVAERPFPLPRVDRNAYVVELDLRAAAAEMRERIVAELVAAGMTDAAALAAAIPVEP